METAQEAQALQQQLQKTIIERQQLETQLQESRIVNKEFQHLADDAKVFKMIGPVLVPQEKPEAETNVQKRLEFIESRIKPVEKRLKELQDALQKKQQDLQQLMAQQAHSAPQPS